MSNVLLLVESDDLIVVRNVLNDIIEMTTEGLTDKYSDKLEVLYNVRHLFSQKLIEKEEIENRKSKGPLTNEQRSAIVDTLIDYVVNKTPADLSDNHDADWFSKSDRGVHWNWKSSQYPVRLVAEKLGLEDEFNNTPMYEVEKILQRVKNSSRVKPIKARAKLTT